MKQRIKIAKDLKLVTTQTSCIEAIFYESGNNPLLPVAAKDERGNFYCFEYAEDRPLLVEVIQSKPGVVRGNHIHKSCTEVFTVMSGAIEMYLLCKCPDRHLLKKRIEAGVSVRILPGIAHAIYTFGDNESMAIFGDNDPRTDRDRIELISLDGSK